MRKIRIGKDIAIRWTLLTNSENISLEGRDLSLVLTTPLRQKINLSFESDGNTLTARFSGVQQKTLGVYTLTLWENFGKDGQTAVDVCQAFELVPYTCMEGGDPNNIETETVDLGTSKLAMISRYGIYSTKVRYIEVVESEVDNPRDDTLYIIV